MPIASPSASRNCVDRLADDLRLIGDLAELNADRADPARCAFSACCNGGADLGDVGAGRHGRAEQHRFSPLVAGLGGRRVLEASPDVRDIAEPEGLLTGTQPQLAYLLDRSEPALDVDADRALAGLDAAGRVHCILAGERRLDVERGKPALGQALPTTPR